MKFATFRFKLTFIISLSILNLTIIDNLSKIPKRTNLPNNDDFNVDRKNKSNRTDTEKINNVIMELDRVLMRIMPNLTSQNKVKFLLIKRLHLYF
jgi:hypothetical protein